MSEADAPSRPGTPGESGAGRLASVPRWKLVSWLVATLCLVAGAVLWFVGDDAPREEGPAATGGARTELAPGASEPRDAGEPSTGAAWSEGFFRLGFSFFAGTAIGYALRKFLKVTLIVAGVQILLLIGLEYAALVEVDWGRFESLFTDFGERVRSDFESFRTVVTGQLPSAGLAVLGLAAGFRRG